MLWLPDTTHTKGSFLKGWPLLQSLFMLLTSHTASQIPLPKLHLGQDTHLDTLRTSPARRKNSQRKSSCILFIKSTELHQQTLLQRGTCQLPIPKNWNQLYQQTCGRDLSDESVYLKSHYTDIDDQTALSVLKCLVLEIQPIVK